MDPVTAIFSFLGTAWGSIASFVSIIWGMFQTMISNQKTQDQNVQNEITQHNSDGALSVADAQSSDAQNAALAKLEAQEDAANQITVTTVTPPAAVVLPKGK